MDAALLGFLGAVFGALVGAVVSLMTTRRSLAHERELALADRDVQRTAQIRAARTKLYARLGPAAERMAHDVHAPTLERIGDQYAVPFDHEWMALLVEAKVVGSTEVAALVDDVRRNVAAAQIAFVRRREADDAAQLTRQPDGANVSPEREAEEAARHRHVTACADVERAVQGLQQQMNAELGSTAATIAETGPGGAAPDPMAD